MHHIRLEVYKNRNQKRTCPQCGKKRFVCYYNYEKNCYINDNVGKCDRESSCGFHFSYTDYFKQYPEERKKHYSTRTFVHTQKSTSGTYGTNPPLAISYIPFDYIEKAAARRNNHFVEFLIDLFDWDTIKNALDPYFIGSTKDRRIIYPQIDADGNLRTAKMMAYDPITGKRKKDGVNAIDWMHSILMKKGLLPDSFESKTCLFGEHLIRSAENKDKTVCILESEKSALLAAIYMPRYLWMASGGISFLNVDKLKPLKDCKIILYPDTDSNNIAFNKWNKIAKDARQMGFDISVSSFLNKMCTPQQKSAGYDLGDFILDDVKASKFEIVLPDERVLSDDENDILNSMMNQNTAMPFLMETFDLAVTRISAFQS